MLELKMYVTPICPHCIKAREFLKENDVKWKEIDVAENHKARNLIFEKTGMVVAPTFEINNKFFVGFDLSVKRELRNELKI